MVRAEDRQGLLRLRPGPAGPDALRGVSAPDALRRVSAVVPALNAAKTLRRTLAALAAGCGEVVVADGGSADGTAELAASLGARVVRAPRGRGTQLRAGAEAARGGWLLFLHADTAPEPGWERAAGQAAAGDPEVAWHFRFALDDPSPEARRLERAVAWRGRWLGLPYGDQGLLISRVLYDRLGGFAPIPLMEDVDMVARLGRARLRPLPVRAATSAARYRRDGWLLRPARNLAVLSLWLAGVPPTILHRLYR